MKKLFFAAGLLLLLLGQIVAESLVKEAETSDDFLHKIVKRSRYGYYKPRVYYPSKKYGYRYRYGYRSGYKYGYKPYKKYPYYYYKYPYQKKSNIDYSGGGR